MGMFSAGRSLPFVIVGAILVAAGLLCLTRYGVETPGRNDAAEFAAWNTGFTVAAAVLIGVGVLLLVTGWVRRRRRRAERRGPTTSVRDIEPGAR